MNKKASMLDNVWVALQLFGFALFMLFIAFFWTILTTDNMDTQFWGKTTEGTNIKADAQRAFDKLDFIYAIVYFGMHLGILVLAYLLRNHPIMYVAVIFITAILVVVAAPLSNVWNEVAAEPEFATSLSTLPKTDYIMDNFPLFEMLWAFVTGVVLIGVSRID